MYVYLVCNVKKILHLYYKNNGRNVNIKHFCEKKKLINYVCI